MDTASLYLTTDSSSEVLDSLWVSSSSPSFHGSAASMVNFEEATTTAERQQLYGQRTIDPKVENEDYDFHPPGKKRRLSVEQVQFLEKSFEVENKLEPDRKLQLAKELGLQPRQVAIWFQNRRARYKTKLLEKEYDALKSSYDKLKADYDNLSKENEKTKNEVNMLTEKLMRKTATAAESEGSPRSAVDSEEEGEMGLGLGLGLVGKVEEGELYEEDLQPNSCNLGFPVQDQGTWFWQY